MVSSPICSPDLRIKDPVLCKRLDAEHTHNLTRALQDVTTIQKGR
jgi:hypothetical protein